MDINGKQISNTTFIIPFRRAAEFLDLKTCVSMMLVNKTINRGLSNNDFASIIVPKIMEVILIDNPANILEYFSFVFFPVADYRELLNAIQKATNWIQNPRGQMGLNKWMITETESNWEAGKRLWYKGNDFSISGHCSGSLIQKYEIPSDFQQKILWAGVVISTDNISANLKIEFIKGIETEKVSELVKIDQNSEFQMIQIIKRIPIYTSSIEFSLNVPEYNTSCFIMKYAFARIIGPY